MCKLIGVVMKLYIFVKWIKFKIECYNCSDLYFNLIYLLVVIWIFREYLLIDDSNVLVIVVIVGVLLKLGRNCIIVDILLVEYGIRVK